MYTDEGPVRQEFQDPKEQKKRMKAAKKKAKNKKKKDRKDKNQEEKEKIKQSFPSAKGLVKRSWWLKFNFVISNSLWRLFKIYKKWIYKN